MAIILSDTSETRFIEEVESLIRPANRTGENKQTSGLDWHPLVRSDKKQNPDQVQVGFILIYFNLSKDWQENSC